MCDMLAGLLFGLLLAAAWLPGSVGHLYAKAHKAYIAEMMR